MKYDILLGLETLLTVKILIGRMSDDLALQIVNAERGKRKLKPLRHGNDIIFVPVLEV